MDKSFIELVLDGQASCEEADDFVERWHESDSTMSLHKYLGLSWEDYALWVKSPSELESIIARRRSAMT